MEVNRDFDRQSISGESKLQDKKALYLSLVKELKPYIPNSAHLKQFSSTWECINLELGDCLANLPISSVASGKEDRDNTNYFYLIIEGQLRLICRQRDKQKEVSSQKLGEGDTFGGDFLFCQECIPYKGRASSATQLARISLAKLRPWLEKYPELFKKWRFEAQQRQTLLFFKTLTPLGSLSSRRLKQLLVYLKRQRIPAGTKLNEVNPTIRGRYWLRVGKVNQANLSIGSSWGYPEAISAELKAETDLSAYFLPQEYWQTALAIAPNLAEAFGCSPESRLSNGNQPKGELLPVASFLPREIDIPESSPSVAREKSSEAKQRKSPSIEFPQPKTIIRRWWHRYPFIEQQSAADCGPTCLRIISQYWGKDFSINWLRELAAVGRSGASLKNLAKAAEALGYNARPVRASLSSLAEQKNPWIAHWEGDHYVVVYEIKGDQVVIADPAFGINKVTRQTFSNSWTGYGLLLEPTQSLFAVPNQKRSLSQFIQLLVPYRSLAIQVIIASLLIQLFGLVTPLFTQIILDRVVVNKSLSTLNVFAAGVLLFGVWNIGLNSVRQYLLSYLSNRLDLTMIGGFIRHALMLPLKFFEMRHVGDIITRVQENQKIQRFLIGQVVLAWLDFVMGFVYLALMLYYNWQLTLLIVGLIPPIIILTLAATPLLRKISREVFNKAAEQNSTLVETITGINTVKAIAAEKELRWRWEDTLTKYLNVRFRSQKLGIGLQSASDLINTIGSTVLLWYGATLVIQDQLSIGQFVAFNMLIGRVIDPVLSLSYLWDELQEVLISVERLNDVFEEEPEETASKSMLMLPRLKGDVCFENVTFRYDSDDDKNTLQNISFTVEAGQTIAIVGRSGSGKTTLVKLLEGLYKTNQGHIWIDGHELDHISPQSLRSQIGVVPQECFLFSGTILENITLYRSEYNLEQAIEAAKLAEAHGFIQSMPLGYNTKVGERGTNLSGGQRQRIAIARALLVNPRILILDEATSSLDTESERRFQQNLARISRDRTIFIIAHRLSTVRNADRILVLDRGVLVQEGNHKELMGDRQGLYYYLAQQQLNL
jgi:ATP-binding cassette subfamily B protein